MREKGSASAELVVIVPVLVLIGLVAVALGRLVLAEGQIREAARAAAEAGSIWPTATQAAQAADAAARYEIVHNSVACRGEHTNTDASAFAPGGRLSVTVSCPVAVAPAIPGLPAEITISAGATAPVEPFREVG